MTNQDHYKSKQKNKQNFTYSQALGVRTEMSLVAIFLPTRVNNHQTNQLQWCNFIGLNCSHKTLNGNDYTENIIYNLMSFL